MFTRVIGKQSDLTSVKHANHIPAANTAAVVTITGVTAYRICLQSVQWSYSVAPTGGKLTITDNGGIIWEVDITASGPGGFSFAIDGSIAKDVVVTLASGTGSCVGKLNVQYDIERDNSL